MGVCPECSIGWNCKEQFRDHLEKHGFHEWRIKQLLSEWDLRSTDVGVHPPDKPCKCRAYGTKFECELRKYGTDDQ